MTHLHIGVWMRRILPKNLYLALYIFWLEHDDNDIYRLVCSIISNPLLLFQAILFISP